MTLEEFEQAVFQAAYASSLCEVPSIRSLTPTSISIRVPMIFGGFVDAFFNEQTSTTAFALIQEDKRIFGADNTGGWHLHPFDHPDRHQVLSGEMSFAEFIAVVERHYCA
jgi:hypothetical protein